MRTRIKHIYVATDKNPMTADIEQHLEFQKVLLPLAFTELWQDLLLYTFVKC